MRRGGGWGAALTATLFALVVPSGASAATEVFSYNGSDGRDGTPQQWVVPAGITSVTFDLYGAQGSIGSGPFSSMHAAGGLGAHLNGVLSVTPGQTLEIRVGGSPPAPASFISGGGFNGGGSSPADNNASERGGGGGGASDVRAGGSALADRVLVAGGGGGGGGRGGVNSQVGPAGGDGGASGTIGAAGVDAHAGATAGAPGGPGTAAAGGAGGVGGTSTPPEGNGASGGDGMLGVGGNAADLLIPSFSGQGGAGGGGYYGGGGAGTGGRDFITTPGVDGGAAGGGGGGSSFSGSATGVTLADGARAGHGQVVITYGNEPAGPAAPVANPNTRITKKPKNRGKGKKKGKKKKRYVFRFDDDLPGVIFLCQLDEKPFEPCASPKVYKKKKLKTGKHSFTVKSVTAAGVESAPQTTGFRVSRKGR